MCGTVLVQLPLNPGAPMEPTGNVPLAGACLAAAAGLPADSVLPQNRTDLYGDRRLIEDIVSRQPDRIGFTLYSWNVERSLYIAGRLREILPGLITMAGGPEVFEDNRWLIDDERIDFFVSGEGEPVAKSMLNPDRDEAYIGEKFLRVEPAIYPPGRWPNPYLSGYLDPGCGDSVYVETVRGCSSSCTYCSYRKVMPFPRVMPAVRSVELLRNLRNSGADDVVFLDPTFNHRQDLNTLLNGMTDLKISCFGEVRGESIDCPTAEKLYRAGFSNVEVGIQSFSSEALLNASRGGDPLKAIQGAARLRDAGVIPILDMMLGLPGDTPSQAIAGASVIKKAGLETDVQVFYLSVLPGTEIRAKAADLGITYMDRPPYYVLSLPELTLDDLSAARDSMADIIGYDLDLSARSLLFDDWPGSENIDLDRMTKSLPAPPSYRHGVIRLCSSDFWSQRKILRDMILRRRKADPFCVLDVVLMPSGEFPLDVIDLVRGLDEPVDYSGRVANVLGRQGNLRVSVLLKDHGCFNSRWLIDLASVCRVVADVEEPDMLHSDLWKEGVCIRLPGAWNLIDLSKSVPFTDQVFFSSRDMEFHWSNETLGLS